jgi:two-component system sensor histidine kinase MprB
VFLTTNPVSVVGQPTALERAVSNLVDNALKFSPADAPVEVSQRGGHVEVRDHGQGISPRDLDRIFDRFYRADATRTLRGSGLGLAIVRDVAVRHHGSTFAMNHANGGAVVGFEVPTASDDSTGQPPNVDT